MKPFKTKDDPQKVRVLQREKRELKKFLREVTDATLLFLDGLDKLMRGPAPKSLVEQNDFGRKVARLCNELDMKNDVARHFGLGLGIKASEKEKAALELHNRCKTR